MITPDEFRRQVAQYDPMTLLQMCAHGSKQLETSSQTIKQVRIYGQNVIVTHHGFATVAMWALRNYPEGGHQIPSFQDVICLANNVYSIRDPFLGTSAGGIMTLVRALYEQLPYQENLGNLIPRHLIIYLETNPPEPPLKLDTAFREATHLSVKEFMAIGLAFWAAALAQHSFERGFVENTEVKSLKPYVTPEKIDAFLAVAGANFDTFRKLCLKEEEVAPELGRYIFNPLFARPVIILPNGLLCLPVPRLVVYRVTRGLYYDLLDVHRQPKRNPFADWFGHAFEQYIGTLLKDTFGEDKVFAEPRYGKPQKDGPDWVVIVGNTALVLECKSGRLPKKIRSQADRTEVLEMIKRNIVDPAEKLVGKLKDLQEGVTGIPTDRVTCYVPAIVTYEEWYPTILTLNLARQELERRNVEDFHFDLMSAEDFERLLAWAEHEDPIKVLREKRSDLQGKVASVGQYVGIRARRIGVTRADNRLLSRKLAEYLGKVVPGLGVEGKANSVVE
jgi:hypothetical protein